MSTNTNNIKVKVSTDGGTTYFDFVPQTEVPNPNPNPTPTPEPNPEPTPEPVPTPTPNPNPIGKDGVVQIYPTKPNGEEWYFSTPTGDKRFDPKTTMTKNADGSYKVKQNQVRMNVFTSTGYDSSKCERNHSICAARGYMQAANDWKNIEITAYVKLNTFTTKDNFAWYARGGKHSDGIPCEGSSYKVDLFNTGLAQYVKEQFHGEGGYASGRPEAGNIGDIKGKWIGFKAIMYNINNNSAVKFEIHIDKENNGQWTKLKDYVDAGGWGAAGSRCGGKPDQVILWGGPIATFRADNLTDFDIKLLSVREIQPPTS